jgi:ketosteroid isomerase-like protein
MRTIRRSAVLALLALLAGSSAALAQSMIRPTYTFPRVDPADSISAVATFQKLMAAMQAGDTSAFVSLFAPDAVVMTPKGEMVPFPEYRRTNLPGLLAVTAGFRVDKDSITRASVNRLTAWVGASRDLSGRADGYFVHVYMESLALMRKTPDGWRVTVLNSTSR